ncbi:TPA: HNH endonuclease family protein, partial [Aeromonas veronii]
NSLNALTIFNVSIMRSFLLALFKVRARGLIKQRRLIHTLNRIENFHFMFNAICSLRPSGIEGIYAKNARNLTYAQNARECNVIINDVIRTLEQKRPTKESFTAKFSELQFLNNNTSNKKLIQYIFAKIERRLRATNEFEPSDLSLEHIANQSDQTIPQKIIGSIGNLLPMGESINGNASTAAFPAKKRIYQDSNYRIVQVFLEENAQDEWNEDLIKARTTSLAENAYDCIWR